MSTHLFRLCGPSARTLRDYVPPNVTASVGAVTPEILVPITLSDDSALPALAESLAGFSGIGWEYVGPAPEE